jgi:hypothetical protein
LNRAQQHAEHDGAGAGPQPPPSPALAGANQSKRCDGKPQHAGTRAFVDDQDVRRRQQPGHVGDDRHHVDVMEVQQVEPAERDQHRTQQRRRLAEPQAPQEPERPGECGRIAGDDLEIEGGAQREQPVEQLMERMEHADLPFAVEIEPGEDGRRPEQRVARLERALIDVAHRQVEPDEVVVDEHPPAEQRNAERRQQRNAAGEDDPGETSGAHRVGFRNARISSARRM